MVSMAEIFALGILGGFFFGFIGGNKPEPRQIPLYLPYSAEQARLRAELLRIKGMQ